MTTRNLTREELEEGIKSLEQSDILRLKGIATTFTGGHEHEAEDLISEAICRVLEGKRESCSENMPLVYFLYGIMRSITYDKRKEYKRQIKLASDLKIEADHSESANIDNAHPQETDLIFAEGLKKLENLFSEDEDVFLLICYLVDEYSPAEIQNKEGWTQTHYNSVRRRLRRQWNQYRDNGERE